MNNTLKAALVAAIVAGERLRQTAPVDDDFPELMHNFDGALRSARVAIDQDKAAAAALPDPVDEVLGLVRAELVRATAKFPTWPDDPLHAVAVVGEEGGELTKAVLQAVYEPHKSGPSDAMDEAVQLAAMAVRFLVSRDRYTWLGCVQHTQGEQVLTGDGTGEALPDFAQLPRIAPPIPPAPLSGEPDHDTMVDASDDPSAMNEALVSIAGQLGVECEADAILEAIERLQDRAQYLDDQRTDQWRALWLVVHLAHGEDGVTLPRHALERVDWSKCRLQRTDDMETGAVRLEALQTGPLSVDAAVRTPMHQAMHRQLLDMLGANDHQGAAARIGELVGLELLLNAGGAGKGVTAIAQERRGQIEREGYVPSEDDDYTNRELVQAAVAYLLWQGTEAEEQQVAEDWPPFWPRTWNPKAFKPRDDKPNLVRAGALIAAELDRLDRQGQANA